LLGLGESCLVSAHCPCTDDPRHVLGFALGYLSERRYCCPCSRCWRCTQPCRLMAPSCSFWL
jgi:hypothetical protein